MKPNQVRLGVVGLDGHGPIFARAVNGPGRAALGARVVAAVPVPSVMVPEKVLAENVAETRSLGIEIVRKPEELGSKVDGILILHDDGSQHLPLLESVAGCGRPIFVDKPLEVSVDAARRLSAVCRENDCPVFTASALRFCAETQELLNSGAGGSIASAMTYCPYLLKPTMPGWIYYGIHAVEHLYALMGPGCKQVHCVPNSSGPVAVGTWLDGRTGIARASRERHHGYGFTVWCEESVHTAAVDVGSIYDGLLGRIIEFVKTRSSPVSIDESVEVIGFLEAANESMAAGGKPVAVKG